MEKQLKFFRLINKTDYSYNKKRGIQGYKTLAFILLFIIANSGMTKAGEFSFFGRLHMDAFIGLKDTEEFSSGFNNRRTGIGLEGFFYDKWNLRIDLDFAEEKLSAYDLRIRGELSENWHLWMGYFKVPQSLNQLTSSKDIVFIERSAISNILAPGRRLGIACEYDNGFVGLKTMIFGRSLNASKIIKTNEESLPNNMPLGIALRTYYAPKTKNGQVHIGTSAVFEDLNKNLGLCLSSYPEAYDAYCGTSIIEINMKNAKASFRPAAELLYIEGPFSFEGEFMLINISNKETKSATFSGYNIQLHYTLTGESQNYSRGVIKGIIPAKKSGAWELGARYSVSDLNDGNFKGGRQNIVTLALNYYITNGLRFMTNVIYADINKNEYNKNPLIGLIRAQYNF